MTAEPLNVSFLILQKKIYEEFMWSDQCIVFEAT